MFANKIRVAVVVCLFVSLVEAQDCRIYGQTCSDDQICCGGCCIDGVCQDTYADCRVVEVPGHDPCSGVYCPEGESCYVFLPENCVGCETETLCQVSTPPPLEIHHHNLSQLLHSGAEQAVTPVNSHISSLLSVCVLVGALVNFVR